MSVYDLSGCDNTVAVVSCSSITGHDSLSSVVHSLGDVSGLSVEQSSITEVATPQGESLSTNLHSTPIQLNPVLAFIKAFSLRADVDTIEKCVCENFGNDLVESAKKALWSFCDCSLATAFLPFQTRCNSDKRSQLTAILMIY